jgi:hypothetical protein
MRFFACSVAFLLIVAGVAVLTGCIPITEHRGGEAEVARAKVLNRERADVERVREELGEPAEVRPGTDGRQRLEYHLPGSSQTILLTLCGPVPMAGPSSEVRRLVLEIDRNGRVRDFQVQ